MAEKFRGTPPLPPPPTLDCCHGRRLVRFSLFPLHFSFFSFTGDHLPAPFPPPCFVSCQLTIGDARCLHLVAEIKAETPQQLPRGTLMALFGSVQFGSGRVCRRRLPPLVGATSTCIFAVAELLLPASCVVAQCVAQVFASTEHKTKTRLESVSKLHRNTATAEAAAALRGEPPLTQWRRGGGVWELRQQSFVMKAATLLRGFHIFSCTIDVHIRNLGTQVLYVVFQAM